VEGGREQVRMASLEDIQRGRRIKHHPALALQRPCRPCTSNDFMHEYQYTRAASQRAGLSSQYLCSVILPLPPPPLPHP
jgi:hypothetical protein